MLSGTPKTQKKNRRRALAAFHFALFVAGITLAVMIVRTGIVHQFIDQSLGVGLWGSFLAGLFFTTMLTTAPATVIFFEIGQAGAPLLPMAIFGGMGALIGDFILFNFLKLSLTNDLVPFIQSHSHGKLKRLWRYKWFSWAMAITGGIIIASPFPDEIGLALMGVGRVKPRVMIVMSFLLNATGIFIVGAIGRASL